MQINFLKVSNLGLKDMTNDKLDVDSRIIEFNKKIERLELEKEAAEFAARNGKSLAEDCIYVIRELLKAHKVPPASFIDDHVRNAIAQRDEANKELLKSARECVEWKKIAEEARLEVQELRKKVEELDRNLTVSWVQTRDALSERDALAADRSNLQKDYSELLGTNERLTCEIVDLKVDNAVLREALVNARTYIDGAFPDWYYSKIDQLKEIDAALGGSND